MLRLLLPLVLLTMGVGGGVGAGLMMSGNASGSSDEVPEEIEAEGRGETGEYGDETAEDGEYPEGTDENPPRVEAASENTEYVRLNNQFVVPIVRNGAVRSMVVMGLTVEVEAGQSGAVFTHEPRLRDTFLRALFAHANAGGFDGTFTEAAAIAPLREALLEGAQGVLGASTTFDVLITDLTRQDS